MKQSNKTLLQTLFRFGSVFLLILVFTTSIFAGDSLPIPIGMAWCQCPFHPSEVTMMNDWALFADGSTGQIFTFTKNGVFNGNLSRGGDCEGPDNFAPFRLTEIDNMVFATCHKESALKVLIDGKVSYSITTSKLGHPGSKPMSVAVNDYYIYVSLDNGHLLSLYFDLEVEKNIEIDCVAVCTVDDNILVLTPDSKLVTYDTELNLISSEDHHGHYLGQLDNPVDMAVDDDGNIWLADSQRVSVWFEDGSYGSWGDKCFDREGSSCGISGDPIAGRNGVFKANSIDVSENYFYLTRKLKHGLAVPRELVNVVTDNSVHFLAIKLSTNDYRRHAKNIWLLQQNLYPQTLVAVFKEAGSEIGFTKDGLYLDGELLTEDISELANIQALSEEIPECIWQEEMTQINFDGEKITVDMSKLTRPFETKLVLLEVRGSTSPLLVQNIQTFYPDRFLKIEENVILPDSPSILYALIIDPDGRCSGVRILRK